MPIDEARRIQLHDAARDRLGPEAALTLMEMLPPVGWADVATKHDLEHLEERLTLRMDTRFGEVDHRFELLETRLEARIEAALSRNLRGTVTTMVALTAVVTTIVTAITQLA